MRKLESVQSGNRQPAATRHRTMDGTIAGKCCIAEVGDGVHAAVANIDHGRSAACCCSYETKKIIRDLQPIRSIDFQKYQSTIKQYFFSKKEKQINRKTSINVR